jgi:hypothetical protein
MSSALNVESDGAGGYLFRLTRGEAVGRITSKHRVARHLETGVKVLHCSANCVGGPDARGLYPPPTVRLVTGHERAIWAMPSPASPRTYPVTLVGEQHYQGAIARCRVGDPVRIWREPSNPHDEDAFAVARLDGATLGYIPRDSFLQRAVHEEDKEIGARILSIEEDRRGQGFTHVVLEVTFDGKPVEERAFSRS